MEAGRSRVGALEAVAFLPPLPVGFRRGCTRSAKRCSSWSSSGAAASGWCARSCTPISRWQRCPDCSPTTARRHSESARSAGSAGQLPPYTAHGGAPSGMAVPGACQGAGRCAAPDPRRDRGQPPAESTGPFLPVPFAQARDEVEKPQGSRNRKSSYSLTRPRIGPEPESLEPFATLAR